MTGSVHRRLILAVIACVLAHTGCATGGDAERGVAGEPSLSTLTRGDFQRDLLLTGELEAVRSISIKAPQTALFQMRISFMAEEGSLVDKGDPLQYPCFYEERRRSTFSYHRSRGSPGRVSVRSSHTIALQPRAQ